MSSPSDMDDWTLEEKRKIERLLRETAVDSGNICIVGSMSISVRGLRKHGDVDIAVDSANRETLMNTSKPNGVSIAIGRYEPLGLTDEDIIHNETYHDIIDGFKIIRPEITLAYKQYRNRPKDIEDVKLIEKYRDSATEWEEAIYQYHQSSRSRSLFSRGITSLRNDGFAVTGIKAIEFIKRRYPILSRLQRKLPTVQLKLALKKISGNDKSVIPSTLLIHQYQNEAFTSMDTVLCYDAIQTAKKENSLESSSIEAIDTVLTDSERETLHSVCENKMQQNVSVNVTPSYRIQNPVETAALLATKESALPLSVSIRKAEPRTADWLQNQGISEDEIERLERSKRKLFERHGVYFYAILWPPSKDYHTKIESMLGSTNGLNIVLTTELELSEMESFVHGVYDAQEDPTSTDQIDAKIKKMKSFGNNIRVLALRLDNPQIRDGNSLTMETIKNDIRNEILSELPNDYYYCILHVTDNYGDNKRTRDVLKSEGYSID